MKTTKTLFASARQLSDVFDFDRDALIRAAREAGIAPTKDGYPVKRMFALMTGTDPGQMTASMRHTLAKAQILEMRAAKEARQLIPAWEVERGQAAIFKKVARAYDTLPSILERDCGLPTHALKRLEEALDVARTELRRALLDFADEPAEAAP